MLMSGGMALLQSLLDQSWRLEGDLGHLASAQLGPVCAIFYGFNPNNKTRLCFCRFQDMHALGQDLVSVADDPVMREGDVRRV